MTNLVERYQKYEETKKKLEEALTRLDERKAGLAKRIEGITKDLSITFSINSPEELDASIEESQKRLDDLLTQAEALMDSVDRELENDTTE